MPSWSAAALAILFVVAPCCFWLWTVLRHDHHEREPWALVVLATALGALSTLGVLALRPWLEEAWSPLDEWRDAFGVTALGEEVFKLLALLPLLLSREVDEPLDGAVYGAAVGIGFAGAENVFFAREEGGAFLLLQRAFTATLLHTACTGSLGLAWAEAKLRRPFGLATLLWLGVSLVLAVGVHGCYDRFLTSDRAHSVIALLGVLPAALVLLSVKLRWAKRRSTEFHPAR
jgi:RsiW-degrading membrane proteinase PrsW (M82 family)